MNYSNKVAELEKQVKELRHELSRDDWINVSQSCDELLHYCKEHQKDDFLLRKSDRGSNNPFRENKGPCMVL